MKVLWVVGSLRNCIRDVLNVEYSNNTSGGWVDASYNVIKNNNDIRIDFLCADKNIELYKCLENEKDHQKAYCVNMNAIAIGRKAKSKQINYLTSLLDRINPDIIHIWGLEHGFGTDIVLANNGKRKLIVFAQGIVGIHAKYFLGDYFKTNNKFFDILQFPGFYIAFIKHIFFKRQAKLERQAIEHIDYVFTDNEFTKKYYSSINKNLKFIDLSLPINDEFVSGNWLNSKHEKRIFTVYGYDMDKGLFQLVKAFYNFTKNHPDYKLVIPGPFGLNSSLKQSLFEYWLMRFNKTNPIIDKIEFTGYLSPTQMKNEILKSAFFVSPSRMETHAGSVREALYLGAPVITSNVGSVGEVIVNEVNGFIYEYSDINKLEYYMNLLANNQQLQYTMSANAYSSIRNKYNLNNTNACESYAKIAMEVENDIQK